MYNYVLPPVLGDAIGDTDSKDIKHIEISNAAMLKECFVEKITQILLSKKKLLLVLPRHIELSVPSKILSTHNLAHYNCAYDEHRHNQSNIVERLNLLTHLKVIPLMRQHLQHLTLKSKEQTSKIQEALLSINKGSIKNPSFKDMLFSVKDTPRTRLPESLIESIEQINLNQRVLQNINLLQNKFRPYFTYIDASTALTPSFLEDEDTLLFARQELAELRQRVEHTVIQLEGELYLMKKVIAHEIEKERYDCSLVKEELQNALLENDLEQHPLSFEDNALPIIKKLKNYKYLKFNLEMSPQKSWGQISNIIQIVDSVMSQVDSYTDKYFQEYLRTLSPFNTNNVNLDQIIGQAYKDLKALKNSKYIDFDTQSNHLQVGVLMDTLEQASHILKVNQRIIEDNDYVSFKKIAERLDIDQSLLKYLFEIKENWAKIIEFYGHRSHLSATYNVSLNRLSTWIDELAKLQTEIKYTSNKEIHNRWCSVREEALTTIKNNDWDLHKSLFEQGAQEQSLEKMVGELGTKFQDFFPILTIHEDQVKSVLTNDHFSFDEVFFLDAKEIDPSHIVVCRQKDLSLSIASTYTLDISEIANKYDVVRYYCSDSRIKPTYLISEMDQTERYRYAIKLASNLNSLVSQCNIYKVKGQVLISTVHSALDNEIKALLGINEHQLLYGNTNELAHFVETFIHHDSIHIVIENGLLNDYTGSAPLWQTEFLKALKASGINVLNIPTNDYYQDRNLVIDGFLDGFKTEKETNSAPKDLILS